MAGLRCTRTNSHQRIGGARLEAVFPFDTAAKTIGFDRLRVRYIGDSRSGMVELGGGYSFSGQGVLASAALQAETRRGQRWLQRHHLPEYPYLEGRVDDHHPCREP